MRTRGARRNWEGVATALVVLGATLGGCSVGGGSSAPYAASSEASVTAELDRVLRSRARAVRTGRLSAFLDGLVADPALRHTQKEWFENLQQLPVARFAHAFSERDVEIVPGGAVAVVEVVLRLDGFDAAAVRTPMVYEFRREQDGVLRISGVRQPDGEEHRATPQPWDLAPVEVLRGERVLGIFDPYSSVAGDELVREVERAIDEVSARVPVPWSKRVVVYALSNTDFLKALDDLPGGDPEQLDGVAFPVPVEPGGDEFAATRFLLHPRILDRAPHTRSRLVRHELVHVALGQLDDRVPTWFSEGLAEYVSVRPLRPAERLISTEAVRAAEHGLQALPDDATFNGPDSAANYGIAWYACEYIAAAYGEQMLWRLLDELRAGGGTSSDGQDAVLLRTLGISSRTLAEAAGRRILSTFGS